MAAGGSARLGRPKQLLEYEGKPLLRRAAETALASHCRPVIVVLGAQAEACAAVLSDLPVRIVVNEGWQEGLASSIRAGLAVLERERPGVDAAILSVADQPYLTPVLLDSLIEHQRATGQKIIAAQYAGHPLSVKDNLGWVLLALVFSIVSYFVVENPLRHWKYLSRSGIRSLCLGALFIGAALGLMAFETGTHP